MTVFLLANESNLSERTKDEQREITSKGGKASVEARRKKKAVSKP